MNLNGTYPAVVRAYDRESRLCKVEIPGFTDGSENLAEAECQQPLGDRTTDNEIRIKPGDEVYVVFLGGDPNYPLITGYRAKNTGNNIGRRHFEQDNIHTIADETQLHEAGTTYTIKAEDITLEGSKTVTLKAGEKILLEVGGSLFELTGSGIRKVASAISIEGPITQTGGDITSDGKSVQFHTHISSTPGQPTSPPI